MFLRRIRASLTGKLFIITALLLLAVCALTYGLIDYFLPRSYMATLSTDLEGKIAELVQILETADDAAFEAAMEQFVQETNATLLLTNMQTGETKTFSRHAASFEVEEGQTIVTEVVVGGEEANDDAVSVSFSFVRYGSEIVYSLYAVGDLVEVSRTQESLRMTLPWLSVAVLLISILGAVVYARYITRPIVRLSAISKRLAALDFSWEAEGNGRTDEIGVLGQNLAELAEKLSVALAELAEANAQLTRDVQREKTLQRQRTELFRSVSHELKTPLTILKAQLEGMIDGVGVYQDRDKYLARALEVASAMEGMVQDILAIARLEDGMQDEMKVEPVDVGSLLQGRIHAVSDLLRQREIELTQSIPQGLCVKTDRAMLSTVLNNLLGNAIGHSPVGGRVRVVASRGETGVDVSIENTGVQIPEKMLPRVFEPFFRVDASRNRQTGGSGLGLYIVKTLLDRMGAAYRMGNTKEGVKFSLTLPF